MLSFAVLASFKLEWAVAVAIVVLAGIGRAQRPKPETLTIDRLGVTRSFGRDQREAVAWKDLVEVWIITTSDGPFAEDFFFVLRAADGSGCLVPNGLAQAHQLLGWLQQLPGFDNMQVVMASGSTAEARFVCWKGEPGQAPAALQA